MLKILEKNSDGEVLKEYWRQFAGWAIALKNRWHDPLFRSEFNVVLLQVAFALTLLILAYIFLSYLYEDILRTVIARIIESISAGTLNSTSDLSDLEVSLEIIKAKNFVLFSTLLAVLTVVFIFLVVKITLRPAKNAISSQKRFISDIAHELRTPLSVIKTNNEVALMEDRVDPQMREMIQSNIEELDRMAEIINNTLSFNTLIRPGRTRFTNIDLGAVIDSVVGKLREFAESKNLQITVKKISPHIVWGSTVALEQIVNNLLKNAINYTDQNGHITIRTGPDYYGNVILHIEDTGIGITKEDLMHIFEPFYRAEKSRNKRYGSSGLGLTIVSELVKMHSGRIIIKSAENEGTVAIVTLPYGKNIASIKEKVDISRLNEVSIDFLRDKNK